MKILLIVLDFLSFNLVRLYNYLQKNPVQALSFLGSSGGLYFWYDKIKNRTRLRIKLIKENFNSDNEKPSIDFEIENVGREVKSIDQDIRFHAIFYSHKRINNKIKTKKIKINTKFKINSPNRILEPCSPKIMTAISNYKGQYGLGWTWFQVYIFKLTDGKQKRVRFRNISRVKLSFIKYYYELLLSSFGYKKIPKNGMSIEEWVERE